MKLTCINTEKLPANILEVGKSYDIKEPYKGVYVVNINGNECSVNLSNFESPFDIIYRLCLTADKIIISKPGQGTTVDLLLSESYICNYSHTKGSHWNLGGNHHKYYHDINTGNYLNSDTVKQEPVFIKQRLLMADYKKIVERYNKQKAAAMLAENQQ